MVFIEKIKAFLDSLSGSGVSKPYNVVCYGVSKPYNVVYNDGGNGDMTQEQFKELQKIGTYKINSNQQKQKKEVKATYLNIKFNDVEPKIGIDDLVESMKAGHVTRKDREKVLKSLQLNSTDNSKTNTTSLKIDTSFSNTEVHTPDTSTATGSAMSTSSDSNHEPLSAIVTLAGDCTSNDF